MTILDDQGLAKLDAAVVQARQIVFDLFESTVGLIGDALDAANARIEIAQARFREMKELLDEQREKAIRAAGGNEETLTADVDAAVGELARLQAAMRLERWRLKHLNDEVADAERIIAAFTAAIDATIEAAGPFDSGPLDEVIARARQVVEGSTTVTAEIVARIRDLEAALRDHGGR